MFKKTLILLALLFCAPWIASADTSSFQVIVDTSSLAGQVGSLDFQFDPGVFSTQEANLQILNFTSGGVLDPLALGAQTIGDVSGTLPGTLTFDNGSFVNDFFEDFTFGSTLTFVASFYGPALTAPDGISGSGTSFAFSMFSDPDGTIPAFTANTLDGFAVTTDVNLDGTTSVSNFSSQTTVSKVPAPEPDSFLLTGLGILGLFAIPRRRWKSC
jgi:hypothetical protein